jgi:hypothetical protein
MEQNVEVTGTNAGVWTFFTHGLNMLVLLFGEFSYPIAIILIVCAIAVAAFSTIVIVKRLAA